MVMLDPMHSAIPDCFRQGDYVESVHAAIRRVSRNIKLEHVEIAMGFNDPELIEDNPGDPRKHSCLYLAIANARALHILCTLTVPVFIISCYWPNIDQWEPGYRVRRQL